MLYATEGTGHTGISVRPPTKLDLVGGPNSKWNNFIVSNLAARVRLVCWKDSPTGEDEGALHFEKVVRTRLGKFCTAYRTSLPRYLPELQRWETDDEGRERVDQRLTVNNVKAQMVSRRFTVSLIHCVRMV